MEHKFLLRLSKQLYDNIKEEAKKDSKPHSSVNSMIVWILEQFLKNNRKEVKR